MSCLSGNGMAVDARKEELGLLTFFSHAEGLGSRFDKGSR